MLTPSTGSQPAQANMYDVSIVLVHPRLSMTVSNLAVVESHLAIHGNHALIGRDVLASCLFTYDGQSGLFTLAF